MSKVIISISKVFTRVYSSLLLSYHSATLRSVLHPSNYEEIGRLSRPTWRTWLRS